MLYARYYYHLLEFLALCGILLVSVSCTLVEKRIDRPAGEPNVPADTVVQMGLESAEQPEEIVPHTVPPGPLKGPWYSGTMIARV